MTPKNTKHTKPTPKSNKWWDRAWSVIPAVVFGILSFVASTTFDSYRTIKMENEKARSASIKDQASAFQNADSQVIVALGKFNNSTLTNRAVDEPKREELLSTLLQVQSNLLTLSKLAPDESTKKAFDTYGDEIAKLSVAVRSTKSPEDMKPIFVSAQNLLDLRLKIAEDLNKQQQMAVKNLVDN
jgi:hypothetical protein